MNRVFARSEEAATEFCTNAREVIGVVALSAGAGSTLVATSLAYLISRDRKRSVAFVEAAEYARGVGGVSWNGGARGCGGVSGGDFVGQACAEPRGCLYDAMGMDKRFAMREYRDIFRIAENGGSIRQVLNIDDRINWAMPAPMNYSEGKIAPRVAAGLGGYAKSDEPYCEESNEKTGDVLNWNRADVERQRADIIFKVINGIAGDMVICDIGSVLSGKGVCNYGLGRYRERTATHASTYTDFTTPSFESSLERILAAMDTVICVVDPAPSALLAGEERLKLIKQWEQRGGKCVYLVNKMSAGVDKRELYKFIGVSGAVVTIDALPMGELHAAEYSCRLPIENKDLRLKLKELERLSIAGL